MARTAIYHKYNNVQAVTRNYELSQRNRYDRFVNVFGVIWFPNESPAAD